MIYQTSRPAYHALKRKIVDGEFPFGAPITVKALESEFEFSAIPIREALIALAAEDLIDFYPGRGFFNKRLDAESIAMRLEVLQNLLLASAATLPDGRKNLVRKRLLDDGIRLREPANSIFESVRLITDILDTYFVHPTAIFTRTAIAQCARYLTIDEQKHDPEGEIGKAAFSYLWLASSRQPVPLTEKLGRFFDIRKQRIVDTIQAVKERDLLAGHPMVFSGASF
ncbi:GntR family transcriptional regulator [Rhizobium leguminosarum]|uniref:GntR family transcriptional regulator n=1 Tax=Rhizobium leguminosarum TaxID=384 RepID=UPI001C9011EE|nr:GntR family transcriptional regulator [Rhizobium leguminosarum]MBY3027439.1 GntR family transcriptional regulator [Rhizobium leguminosarum]